MSIQNVYNNCQNGRCFKNKPAAQAAGQTLPDATPPQGKTPQFTKIAVTFDPIKGFSCPSRFRFS